jgi:predicted RNase H-like HicB family nuclease
MAPAETTFHEVVKRLVMRYYIALVHKDEGSSFGVSFPDVPGAFSAADDMAGLIPTAAEALNFLAEDEALPLPRSLEEVRLDPAVAEELSRFPSSRTTPGSCASTSAWKAAW